MKLAGMGKTCSLGAVGSAASKPVAARLRVPARIRLVTAAADADAAPAAATPALEQQTPPAAAEVAAQVDTLPGSSSGERQHKRGRDKQQRTAGKSRASPTSSSSSSSSFAEAEVVAVRSTTDTTSAAAFIANRLVDQPRATLRLNPAGGQAGLNALKMVAKAGQMIANKDTDASSSSSSSSPQLTFQIERRLVRVGNSSSSKGAEGGDARGMDLSVNAFFVRRAPAGSLSADLQGADEAPMVVRLDTDYAKITAHALYHMQRSGSAAAGGASSGRDGKQQQQEAIAAFVLAGGQLPARVKVLLRGLSDARRRLYDEGEADLMFTVERSVQELTKEERQQWQQRCAERQQQQQDEDSAAAQAGGGSGGSSSSGGGSGEQLPLTKAVYIIRAYPCKPNSRGGRAPRRRGGSSSEEQAGAGRSSRPRDGYVQVPAAEWSALREQLEVVPHLTQQLQTMTQQHEQLLSLLAAQQGEKPGAAAAAEPEQAQQQQQQQ